jgi:hypothetical protein
VSGPSWVASFKRQREAVLAAPAGEALVSQQRGARGSSTTSFTQATKAYGSPTAGSGRRLAAGGGEGSGRRRQQRPAVPARPAPGFTGASPRASNTPVAIPAPPKAGGADDAPPPSSSPSASAPNNLPTTTDEFEAELAGLRAQYDESQGRCALAVFAW